jgi:hypothetical protein
MVWSVCNVPMISCPTQRGRGVSPQPPVIAVCVSNQLFDLGIPCLTVDVGTTDTACINGDVDIVFLKCLELELLLVERLPSVIRVNGCSPTWQTVTYCLGSLTTNPVAVSG